MGGEGSMMHAIKSLKQNRALMKKRKRRKREDYISTERTELNLKRSTPQDMEINRKKIAVQKKKNLRATLYAIAVTILLLALFYWWLS